MAFREVRVFEVREVLRLWLRGEGCRSISRLAGMDRKTVGRYVEAAESLAVSRDGDDAQLSDDSGCVGWSVSSWNGFARTAPTATARRGVAAAEREPRSAQGVVEK